MLRIVNIGMSHETAPVELRECLAKDPSHADRALALMREIPCIKESLFLSTCNRVEALFTTEQTEEANKKSTTKLNSTRCHRRTVRPHRNTNPQTAGMISHVPGGLGVFETTMILLCANRIPAAGLLGTLVGLGTRKRAARVGN